LIGVVLGYAYGIAYDLSEAKKDLSGGFCGKTEEMAGIVAYFGLISVFGVRKLQEFAGLS